MDVKITEKSLDFTFDDGEERFSHVILNGVGRYARWRAKRTQSPAQYITVEQGNVEWLEPVGVRFSLPANALHDAQTAVFREIGRIRAESNAKNFQTLGEKQDIELLTNLGSLLLAKAQ